MHRYCLILSVMVMVLLGATGCAKNPSEEGLVFLKQGQYEEAIGKFQEAIDAGINPADAYRGMGMAKWEMQDVEGARDAFENALKNNAVQTATIYNFLGVCEQQLGNYRKALNYFRIGMEEECSEELMQEMRYNEIVCFEALEEWASAETKLQQYIADYPDDKRAVKEAEFFETR